MRTRYARKLFKWCLVSGFAGWAAMAPASAQVIDISDEAALKAMLKEVQADEVSQVTSPEDAEKTIAIILKKIKAIEAAKASGMPVTNTIDATIPINDIFKNIRAGEAAQAAAGNTNNAAMTAMLQKAGADEADESWRRFFTFHKVTADDDWTRHMRLGAVVGLNISANFKESGLFTVPGNAGASGIYDDGYVLADQSGDAQHTGYWGYDNASQYNAAAQTLTMHSVTSYATSGSSSDSGGPFVGFDLDYGANLFYWQHIRVGWDFGFGLMPMKISDNSTFSATINETAYTYNTAGITVPGAPYQGGASGNGEPILPTTPSSESQSLETGTVAGSRSLDMMLYSIRLGPQFYWDLSRKISMSVGFGPAVGFLTTEYKYDEIITTGAASSHNTGSFNTDNVVLGGYVNAALMYHIEDWGKKADLYVGAQYMPMGSTAISNGGRAAQVNLNGQVYLSAGVSWSF